MGLTNDAEIFATNTTDSFCLGVELSLTLDRTSQESLLLVYFRSFLTPYYRFYRGNNLRHFSNWGVRSYQVWS
jgi:hypothetical protein